jgi:hypothetical protein
VLVCVSVHPSMSGISHNDFCLEINCSGLTPFFFLNENSVIGYLDRDVWVGERLM